MFWWRLSALRSRIGWLPSRRRAAGLFDEEGDRERLIQKAQASLAVAHAPVGGVEEEAALAQDPVQFAHGRGEPAHVEVASPRPLGAGDQIGEVGLQAAGKVPSVRGVVGDHRRLGREQDGGVSDVEAAGGAVERRHRHAIAEAEAEVGRMPERDVARGDDVAAGAQEAARGEDGEEQAEGRADANAARAVDGVDGDVEGSGGGELDDLFGFFGQDGADAGPGEGSEQVIVRRDVERLLFVAAVVDADHRRRVAGQATEGEPLR